MILVFYWQINALMLLALQHSTYAAILDLVARAMFLEAAVLLLSMFISEISPSNTYAAIHDLIAQSSDVLEAAVLLLFTSEEFLRPIQGENLAWSTAVVLVFS